ncbi:MAG: glycosyltransferase family 2 protein [Burkholderiaceae bacterium]
MKTISIVTPCYNEEDNVDAVYTQVKQVFEGLKDYQYEHIFIDNASTDKTASILRTICAKDSNVKVILNARNFGHIRSPYYGLLQSQGDASILLVADLQDPPTMIADFIRKWEEGYKVVLGIKTGSEESRTMFSIRKSYYKLIDTIAETKLVQNNTGFGLYDKSVIKILREMDEPYPYLRGLVPEIGFDIAKVEYLQPKRARGITKNNFYTLYDMAMLGITNHSKVPLRIATFAGFAVAFLSLLVAVAYFIAKLLFWDKFSLGVAPLIIGFFFFSSVQLIFLGILGEYIGNIYTQILKRPLVIEKERINF